MDTPSKHSDLITKYNDMYAASIVNPDDFWREHAGRLHWSKPFSRVKNTSFAPGNIFIKWFEDGELNVSYNCIDRHLGDKGDQIAILF